MNTVTVVVILVVFKTIFTFRDRVERFNVIPISKHHLSFDKFAFKAQVNRMENS